MRTLKRFKTTQYIRQPKSLHTHDYSIKKLPSYVGPTILIHVCDCGKEVPFDTK
jgi:hypothetical protein